MLDIEIIKWGCGVADGFEIRELGIYKTVNFYNGDYFKNYNIKSDEWIYDKYGDFLQRVIEGINRKHNETPETTWSIWINQYTEKVYANFGESGHSKHNEEFLIDSDIDKAKEQAIKYIFSKIK